MKSLDECLSESYSFHGERCPGQVLGTRMAIMGCRSVGIDDPKSDRERKKIIVYAEMDRCATDSIIAVTGCKPGKRTLKIKDYGIMAATFINLETGKAVRIIAREEARNLAQKYAPDIEDKYEQQREAYRIMPEDELFSREEVVVEIPEGDMPGRPIRRVTCEQCGVAVQDCKEVVRDGKILCKPCALRGYFSKL